MSRPAAAPRPVCYSVRMDPLAMPSGSPATCSSCRFWRLDRRSGRGAGWGQCRRMPPALPPIRADKLKLVGIWPETQDRDWCGEWQPLDMTTA